MLFHCCFLAIWALAFSAGLDTFQCVDGYAKINQLLKNDRDLKYKSAMDERCGKNAAQNLTYDLKWECDIIKYGKGGNYRGSYWYGYQMSLRRTDSRNERDLINSLENMYHSGFCNSVRKWTNYACTEFRYEGFWDNVDKFGCVFYNGGPETYGKK